MPGDGDVWLCPGALNPQRSRMRSHPVARFDLRRLVSDCGDQPGCLHA
jgi:hypothetical protein